VARGGKELAALALAEARALAKAGDAYLRGLAAAIEESAC